jgi:putative aldouronate transport system substrate-binding protein
MRGKFITGVADVKTGWDEYVATIKKMDIEEVLKIYQTAYDRWNEL